VTGVSTYWGARLARALERHASVDVIIGVDSSDPTQEFQRTEFVRVSNQHALLRRIVQAAEIDTVIDSRLTVDALAAAGRRAAHENNVMGTLNILAACAGPDSPVRKLVFKSSAHYYGCSRDDPGFFTEDMKRANRPNTELERDIVEAEAAVRDFASKHDQASVSLMRFCNVLGPDIATSHARLLALPVVPMIGGFDPRYQFVHADDVVTALEFAVENDLDGIYNVAPDGVLAMSEVVDLLGKRALPVLPPFGTAAAGAALRRAGVDVTREMLGQLRYGRGLDNRKLKAAGFRYRYTTREAVEKFGEHLRLRAVIQGAGEPYRYEKEVEDFLRWSPSVRHRKPGTEPVDLPGPAPAFRNL
jgi:UDP-glucose 4-epimerase